MQKRKARLTLGRMMAAIGIVALGFAMSRVDAAPAVSLCVFAACTWYLAARRYAEALARLSADDATASSMVHARLAVRCTITAALAIGLPDAVFLGGLYGYMAVLRRVAAVDPRWRPDLEPMHILIGAMIGIAAALYVAALMRRGSKRARLQLGASPVPRPAESPSPSLIEHAHVAPRRASAS